MRSGEPDSEIESLLFELISVRESIRGLKENEQSLRRLILRSLPGALESTVQEAGRIIDEEREEAPAPAEHTGPRIVAPNDREQAASTLLSPLMDALIKYFVGVEEHVRSENEAVYASLWQELEETRGNASSQVRSLSIRVGEQQGELSSLRRLIEGAVVKLDQHADIIRAVKELTVLQAGALGQVLEALTGLGAWIEAPPTQMDVKL